MSASKWEDAWEERFHGNRNLVVTRLKGGKSIRVDVYCETEGEAAAIAAQFGGTVKRLVEKNWVALSAKPRPPIKIREVLLVTEETSATALRSLQSEYPGRKIVTIPPEMAFGTGDHPTTATCLRFLADEAKARRAEPWRMLDLGCGTGVLAIAARMLGAERCEGLDYDPQAVRVAAGNVSRNGADGVSVAEADVLEWESPHRFEVVAANLFSDVLIKALPRMRGWLAPAGSLILSGILREQWEAVAEAALGAGFTVREVRRKGKWVSGLLAAR